MESRVKLEKSQIWSTPPFLPCLWQPCEPAFCPASSCEKLQRASDWGKVVAVAHFQFTPLIPNPLPVVVVVAVVVTVAVIVVVVQVVLVVNPCRRPKSGHIRAPAWPGARQSHLAIANLDNRACCWDRQGRARASRLAFADSQSCHFVQVTSVGASASFHLDLLHTFHYFRIVNVFREKLAVARNGGKTVKEGVQGRKGQGGHRRAGLDHL